MDLKTYLAPKTSEQRDEFASLCSTSRGHLQNVMYGVRPCAAELAVLIEKHSEGAVTRKDLRPDDWQAIWPELAVTPELAKPPAPVPRTPKNHPSQRAGDKQGVQ